MADTWLKGAALDPSVAVADGQYPTYADAATLIDANGWSEATLTALGVTKISLHSADPGTTGANEIAGTRIAISVLVSTDLLLDGDTDGNEESSGGYTATHFGLWTDA